MPRSSVASSRVRTAFGDPPFIAGRSSMRTVSRESWVTMPVMYGAPSGHAVGRAEPPVPGNASTFIAGFESLLEHATELSTKVIAINRPPVSQPRDADVGPHRLLDTIRPRVSVIVLRSFSSHRASGLTFQKGFSVAAVGNATRPVRRRQEAVACCDRVARMAPARRARVLEAS
jgi:hypothetical protein